ncbi:MAG: ParB N-terminal domain-containing protein [Jiangellaceae bacterium]
MRRTVTSATTMRVADLVALRVKPVGRLRRGPDGVEVMAEDIRINGIREPLLLDRKRDGGLHLANGNHRLAAAELLGLAEVPVQIRER